MAASISYPSLSSETTLFQTRNDAVAFFNAITVPAATELADGVVKRADYIDFSAATVGTDSITVNVIQGDGSVILHEVPTYANFLALKNAYDALAAKFSALITALQNAGIMSTS